MSESSSNSDDPSGPVVPPTQEGFKLSPQDVTILRGYMDEFEQADTQMRNKILEKAMGEVYKRQPGNSQFNKKEKIRKWYYNHYSPPHRQVIKFVRRWSARNVFYHEDKADIMKLAEDMSGAAPGTETFFGSIQDATTELWKKLPVEEQERFAQTAEEWSDNGPPKGIQAKMASAAIRGRIVSMYIIHVLDEWNADVGGGMDFNDFCPKWRSTVLWDTWKKYGRKCFEQDDDQNAQKDPSRTIKIPVQITTNATGEPEIPSIVKGDGHQTKVVQTALRGYCTAHIRFISGKPYATIPWAKLSTTPTAWIQEECYPPGFKWADPSKIRLNDDLEKTSKHLPARRRHQNASTSDVDGDEENYAQELNNITDNSSVLPLPPPPPSLHPVQRGPAGSDTEGLEQAGIGFAQSLEHPSVPHHSSSFNVERSDNMQPSEPTPTELTHNPARAQSNPQQTPSQSMAHPQRDHGGPVASTSGHSGKATDKGDTQSQWESTSSRYLEEVHPVTMFGGNDYHHVRYNSSEAILGAKSSCARARRKGSCRVEIRDYRGFTRGNHAGFCMGLVGHDSAVQGHFFLCNLVEKWLSYSLNKFGAHSTKTDVTVMSRMTTGRKKPVTTACHGFLPTRGRFLSHCDINFGAMGSKLVEAIAEPFLHQIAQKKVPLDRTVTPYKTHTKTRVISAGKPAVIPSRD
ncbi:hypothetical protein EDB84DRAFT_1437709 [Lactarius hengduanensis]|nr:hypothetical protein EDB84DRAFT_1437709 [Lactarius hengduanensis]